MLASPTARVHGKRGRHQGGSMASKGDVSRRGFLAGAAGLGAFAVAGMAGCSPKAAGEKSSGKGAAAKGASTRATSLDPYEVPAWAGADPEVADADIVDTRECDLLIVGAGNGGMAAAAYAASQGVDIIVCEKGTVVGGTRHWFAALGTRPFVEKGLTVDRQRLMGEIVRYSSGCCNQDLIRMWMDESNEMFEFVDSIMTPAGAHVVADDHEMPGGMGGTSFYTPPFEHHYVDEKGGRDFEERNVLFEKYIKERGYEVSFGHDLVKLEGDVEAGVTGALFKLEKGYARVKARKGVLLTTGGYSANSEMLTALSPITVKSVTALGYNQNNMGGGIQAAVRFGAVKDLTSATMIFDRGLVAPGTAAGYTKESIEAGMPQFPGNGQFNPGTQPFLKVDMTGRRFCMESAQYDYPAHAVAQRPGGVYVSVWDANFGEDVQRFHTLGCSAGTRMRVQSVKRDDGTYDLDKFFKKELEDGRLQKADTLDELADKLGFAGEHKKNFLASCERYNELYDKGEDEDFFKEGYRLSELRTPPFYGATLGGTLLTTLDGVRINGDCQALAPSGNPIPRLYCAGDCSGSVFAGNYPDQLHGFACGRTMTEAIHAVRHATA
ncbi:FAD-binding protein [Eggerthellaceae bacterium zg-1084]|nr:FAD-binding protein [Berryella wangjianweii]